MFSINTFLIILAFINISQYIVNQSASLLQYTFLVICMFNILYTHTVYCVYVYTFVVFVIIYKFGQVFTSKELYIIDMLSVKRIHS